ncbi:MAG: hypothetical protein IPI59_08480 [Sphingobacteriales bacterium]|jgi:YHS domain-containing protein|nr:hypothetical protein [Sphingobacteriales bacterium]MBP9140053.1 hypothetical protein [Chitinophagales bacterium]MBK6889909.1 hypothetical protein [Sphingobacteriales bacterium]MBK7527569.1 hypothetical protein [Sphingobacteriales bacterium]MBK8678081.1 hypothetical protein [Sphingobacteriales bacterium]
MKKIPVLALFLTSFLLVLLVACGGNNQKMGADTSKPSIKIADETQLATWKDVVCGMTMRNLPISDTAVVNGKIYPFCAAECKAEFNKNRDKFVLN